MQRCFLIPVGLRFVGAMSGEKFGAQFHFDGRAEEFAGVGAIFRFLREPPQRGCQLQ